MKCDSIRMSAAAAAAADADADADAMLLAVKLDHMTSLLRQQVMVRLHRDARVVGDDSASQGAFLDAKSSLAAESAGVARQLDALHEAEAAALKVRRRLSFAVYLTLLTAGSAAEQDRGTP